jgi:hypothetical protein
MKTKTKKAGSRASGLSEAAAKPRLLCEGWLEEGCEGTDGLVFRPERAYVVQPAAEGTDARSRVWFAYGSDRQLDESFGPMQVVENYDELDLEERQVDGTTVKLPRGGRWIVEGPAQRSDVKNANKRIYGRTIWEKLIADPKSYVQESIRERQMVGHLEHPKDGRTDLNETALLTTKAVLREDGVVWNQFELLDTPKGLILQELTRKRVKWGVSSRGTGTVGDDGHVSETDYVLKTWDAVASPSTPGAHPALVTGKGVTEKNATETVSVDEGELEALLTSLDELAATDVDGLSDRARLRSQILDTLESLDENMLQAVLLKDQGWSKIKLALEKAREPEGGAFDAAIEEALASGEGQDGLGEGMEEVFDSLQEQVSDLVTENDDLRTRLEAAESAREAQAERLAEAEGELTQLRVERDLARELLAETPTRNVGDVSAAVDEVISEAPELERFRDLMEDAQSPEQVRNFAERLVPIVKPKPAPKEPVEETVKPKRRERTALPVGMALDETANVKRSKPRTAIDESSGARIVAAMPAFKKTS